MFVWTFVFLLSNNNKDNLIVQQMYCSLLINVIYWIGPYCKVSLTRLTLLFERKSSVQQRLSTGFLQFLKFYYVPNTIQDMIIVQNRLHEPHRMNNMMDGWMLWIDGWMDSWMEWWMDGCIDNWIEWWMNHSIHANFRFMSSDTFQTVY